MTNAEIEVLARNAQSGVATFTELWISIEPKVRKQIVRSISRKHPNDVDDVLQQVAMTVWRDLPSFRGDAKFLSWMYMVTDSTCLHFIRDNKRTREGEVPLLNDDGSDAHNLVDPRPSPQSYLESRESEAAINVAIDSLPGQQPSILRMRVNGMNHRQIAQALGIDEHSSRTMHSRAVSKMRQQFDDGPKRVRKAQPAAPAAVVEEESEEKVSCEFHIETRVVDGVSYPCRVYESEEAARARLALDSRIPQGHTV